MHPALSISLLLLVSSAAAAPPLHRLQARGGTPSSQGFHDGFYYNYWTDGGANATYSNLPGGSFSIDWGTGGNLVGGKGWQGDSFDRIIEYSADYNYNGTSYLAAYGWANDPQAEYYIVENHAAFNPITGTRPIGTLEIDGSTYDLGEYIRNNWPPIGVPVVYTYVSVRRDRRTSGVINVGAHVKAWKERGSRVGGTNVWTIMGCEGYFSKGNCTVTVSVRDAATPGVKS